MQLTSFLSLCIWLTLCLGAAPPGAQETPQKPGNLSNPYTAGAEGGEVRATTNPQPPAPGQGKEGVLEELKSLQDAVEKLRSELKQLRAELKGVEARKEETLKYVKSFTATYLDAVVRMERADAVAMLSKSLRDLVGDVDQQREYAAPLGYAGQGLDGAKWKSWSIESQDWAPNGKAVIVKGKFQGSYEKKNVALPFTLHVCYEAESELWRVCLFRIDFRSRPPQAPPFTAKLADGREALITPDPKKVARYGVTEEYFQQNVVAALGSPSVDDPAKVVVLGGLIVAGNVPHATGPDKVHRSLGEPLEHFARVEVRGKVGPQAAELVRMRAAYEAFGEAMRHAEGASRPLIEKRFGLGKLYDPERPDGPWVYPLPSGRLMVHWKKDGKTVDYCYPLHDADWPTAKADEPEKLATQAREVANARRAVLFEYLARMRDTLTPEERNWVRELLGRSQEQLRWTEEERRLMLGDAKQ
jgi:hypothetical protein